MSVKIQELKEKMYEYMDYLEQEISDRMWYLEQARSWGGMDCDEDYESVMQYVYEKYDKSIESLREEIENIENQLKEQYNKKPKYY